MLLPSDSQRRKMSKLAPVNEEKLKSLMKRLVCDLHRQGMVIIENEIF